MTASTTLSRRFGVWIVRHRAHRWRVFAVDVTRRRVSLVFELLLTNWGLGIFADHDGGVAVGCHVGPFVASVIFGSDSRWTDYATYSVTDAPSWWCDVWNHEYRGTPPC